MLLLVRMLVRLHAHVRARACGVCDFECACECGCVCICELVRGLSTNSIPPLYIYFVCHDFTNTGKTTVAVKVVNDDEVRSEFEKILWVGVGQEPDVRELLGSLAKQINEQILKPDLSDKEALAEVKKAAKGLKCLLVLDDVVGGHSDQRNPAHALQVLRKSHTFNAPSGRPSSSEL